MKKMTATLLTLLTCSAAHALPVGNPAEATLFLNGAWWDGYCCDPCDPCFSWCDAWSIRIGYYGDFVFNRHLKRHSDLDTVYGENIDTTQIFTNAGYLALNVCDRLDVFGTLGETSIRMYADMQSWGNVITFLSPATAAIISSLDYQPEFSWSAGARATLWECECFFLGIEGQYFQTNPHINQFIDGTAGQISYFNDSRCSQYSEWQVGLGASYRFATSCPSFAMVPYAAVKWSGAEFKQHNIDFLDYEGATLVFPNLKNSKTWGYAIGMSLTLNDMVGATVEGRWGDEKAVSVVGQFRF